MLKRKKMYVIGRIQADEYHNYDRLGVITQNNDDIRNLLIDFSNQWDTSCTLNADRTHITDVAVSDYEEW